MGAKQLWVGCLSLQRPQAGGLHVRVDACRMLWHLLLLCSPTLPARLSAGARPHERAPMFKMLHWYLAAHLAARLQALAGLSDLELRRRVVLRMEEEAAAPPQQEDEEGGAAAAAAEVHGNSGSVLGTSQAGASGRKRKRGSAEEEEGEEVTARPRQTGPPRHAAHTHQPPQPPQQQQQPNLRPRPHLQRPAQPQQLQQQYRVPPPAGPGKARVVGQVPSRAGTAQRRPASAGPARLPGRLPPTQQRIDVRGGGGGDRRGGGWKRKERDGSPDSFIARGGDEEEVRCGSTRCGSSCASQLQQQK